MGAVLYEHVTLATTRSERHKKEAFVKVRNVGERWSAATLREEHWRRFSPLHPVFVALGGNVLCAVARPDDEHVLVLELLGAPEVVGVHDPAAERLHALEMRDVRGAEVTSAGDDVVKLRRRTVLATRKRQRRAKRAVVCRISKRASLCQLVASLLALVRSPGLSLLAPPPYISSHLLNPLLLRLAVLARDREDASSIVVSAPDDRRAAPHPVLDARLVDSAGDVVLQHLAGGEAGDRVPEMLRRAKRVAEKVCL